MKPSLASRLTAVVVVLIGVGLTGPSMIAEGRHPIGGGPKPSTVVVVPPGHDAIADALQRAGAGGLVVLQAGLHTESGTVLITQPVTLAGEPGAILESTTVPQTALPTPVDPALHVRDTSDVRVIGIDIRAAGGHGDTAVLLENSPSVTIANNSISAYTNGVLIERSNSVRISGNTMDLDPTAPLGALGVTVINGRSAVVDGNRISNTVFGIWACDREGEARGNVLTNNFIGLILCKVPQGSWIIGGREVGSDDAGTAWSVRDNVARENAWGYLVIDGANNSRLTGNAGGHNSAYDIEMTGDTYRFGFLTPSSFETVVNTGGDQSLVVKDCGRDNRVTGSATLVDTTVDPCF